MALTVPTSFASQTSLDPILRLPSSFPDHLMVFLFFSTSPCASTSGGSPIRTWCEPAFPGAIFSISSIACLSTSFTTKQTKHFALLCTLHKTLRPHYCNITTVLQNALFIGISGFQCFSGRRKQRCFFSSKSAQSPAIIYKSVINIYDTNVTFRKIFVW